MDRSEVKIFSLILGGGGGFSATKTKVAQSEMDRSGVKIFPLILGGGEPFLPPKTKVAGNCLKWIDLVLKIFP